MVKLGPPVIQGAERAEMWILHGYAIYRSLTGDYFESGFGLYKKGKDGDWKSLTMAHFNYDDRLKAGEPRKERKVTLTVSAHKPPGSEDA